MIPAHTTSHTEKRRIRCILIPVALALTFTACGGDASPDAAATTPMSMQDDGHTHDGETAMVEWDGGLDPRLNVMVTGNPADGWDVTASIEGFTFTDPTNVTHEPGFGHTHVLVDGRVISMAYDPVFHIDSLEPGTHEITVVLSRNDHVDYSLDGVLISSSVVVEVEGEVTAPNVRVNVTYRAGAVAVAFTGDDVASRGDIVEIHVDSDIADEVHIHGYDIRTPVKAGEVTTVRFVADLPGVFEVELEDAGRVLFDLEVR